MRSTRYSLISVLLIAAALVGGYYVSSRPKDGAKTSVRPPASKTAPTAFEPTLPAPTMEEGTPSPHVRPSADPPDTRLGELPAAPQASKAQKDGNGNAISETVMTPDGPITIQRTFTTSGELVRERAILNGKPVPVPSQITR